MTEQDVFKEQAQRTFAAALKLSLRQPLLHLAASPPQVLLLEGGTEDARSSLARWWAALLNCTSRVAQGPCLHCSSCLQIGTGEHLDLIAADGRISNQEDKEKPGPVRALNMEWIHELRSNLGEAPHGPGRRVVIMAGLDVETRAEAANALLKTLEEPPTHTIFVLLTPQREQLFPTLVSRSWVLTLPWPATAESSPSVTEWENALARFLDDGTGWFERTSVPGLKLVHVQELVLACQKALAAALVGHTKQGLARCFATRMDTNGIHTAGAVLGRMQDALQYTVNPALAADALATELYALLRKHTWE